MKALDRKLRETSNMSDRRYYIEAALIEADERATARTRTEERALAAEAREYAGKLEEAGGLGWRVRAKAAEAALNEAIARIRAEERALAEQSLRTAYEMQEKAVAEARREEQNRATEALSIELQNRFDAVKTERKQLIARLKAPDAGMVEAVITAYYTVPRYHGDGPIDEETVAVIAAALAAYLETPDAKTDASPPPPEARQE